MEQYFILTVDHIDPEFGSADFTELRLDDIFDLMYEYKDDAARMVVRPYSLND